MKPRTVIPPNSIQHSRIRRLLWKFSRRFRRTSIHALRNSTFIRKAILWRPS